MAFSVLKTELLIYDDEDVNLWCNKNYFYNEDMENYKSQQFLHIFKKLLDTL